jgi:hypothetical protein
VQREEIKDKEPRAGAASEGRRATDTVRRGNIV